MWAAGCSGHSLCSSSSSELQNKERFSRIRKSKSLTVGGRATHASARCVLPQLTSTMQQFNVMPFNRKFASQSLRQKLLILNLPLLLLLQSHATRTGQRAGAHHTLKSSPFFHQLASFLRWPPLQMADQRSTLVCFNQNSFRNSSFKISPSRSALKWAPRRAMVVVAVVFFLVKNVAEVKNKYKR